MSENNSLIWKVRPSMAAWISGLTAGLTILSAGTAGAGACAEGGAAAVGTRGRGGPADGAAGTGAIGSAGTWGMIGGTQD